MIPNQTLNYGDPPQYTVRQPMFYPMGTQLPAYVPAITDSSMMPMVSVSSIGMMPTQPILPTLTFDPNTGKIKLCTGITRRTLLSKNDRLPFRKRLHNLCRRQ